MMLQVIPAVDIMGARSVRLLRGIESERRDYGDPLEFALLWAGQGAKMIHVIDLDAAFGKGGNQILVRRIIKESCVDVQVGGGIRTISDAAALLDFGASRVIIGSLAFLDPEALERLLHLYGDDRVVVSLDHSGGMLKIHGWRTDAGACIDEAFDRFVELGVSRFLVTSIDNDGALSSPDIDTIMGLTACARIMAAGGVGDLEDLKRLKASGVEAAVVGKALYEGRFTLPKAMEAAQS
jgi:phosphoribosylformimino-5-aminoimidazole carboxamide ribotide isomerase